MILEVCLPDTNGFHFCRQIRQQQRMPIIFLSSRDDCADKVVGLEVGGGDDYLTKPFSPRELTARVRAQMRPRRRIQSADGTAGLRDAGRAGRLTRSGGDALCDSKPARLTDKEFELLALLARHRGQGAGDRLDFLKTSGAFTAGRD